MHARFPIALISFVRRTCASAVFVLLAILGHDGPSGSWPSVGRLMRESGCSESAVHRALLALVRCGVLLACRRRRMNGADTTTAYTLAPKWRALLGCQSRQGEGATGDTPLDPPEHTTETSPMAPTLCRRPDGSEVASGAGGDAPPAPPAAPSDPCALGPAERAGACLAVLAWNAEAYPAAHGGRAYFPQRTDGRAVARLVAYAVASGCRSAAAVRAWVAGYLARFWTLGGRWAERGHRLADAPKPAEVCRPRPRPTVVRTVAPPAPADPDGFRRALRSAAGSGVEFAIALSQRIGVGIAGAW